jgi:hypothetical protein
MTKHLSVEITLVLACCLAIGLAIGGIETLPRYMLDYIFKANLVYQGF